MKTRSTKQIAIVIGMSKVGFIRWVLIGYMSFFLAGAGYTEELSPRVQELTEKAEQGDAKAQHNLGSRYYTGIGVPRDYKQAAKWYTKAAEQGYASAQYNLAFMFNNGVGVLQDDKQAFKWFKKAAEQGEAKAQYNLAFMFNNGEGVPQDDKQAVKWYTKAAEQGYASAQYNLALMYYDGEGVLQDDKQAVKWYTKAAEQGHASAQNNLALMFNNGEGVPQDDKQAVKWYTKAAEQGYASAQNNLALMYHKGEGTPQNYEQAFKWFKKAAEQGYASAQYHLALMYYDGEGVHAAMSGVSKTKEMLATKLTSEQIAKGLARAKELQKEMDKQQQASGKREHEIKKQFSYTFKEVRDKLVVLNCISRLGKKPANGFIAKSDEGKTYIYTNQHVIMGANPISFKTAAGEVLQPTAVELSAKRDIARLLIDDHPAFTFADSLAIGIPLAVFGNIENDVKTELYGKVTGIGTNNFKVSAEFAEGNSGSPVLNLNKEVIGVASYIRFTPMDKTDKDTRFENEARRSCCRVTDVEWLPVNWRQYNRTVGTAYRETEDLIISAFDVIHIWHKDPQNGYVPDKSSNDDLDKWAKAHNRVIGNFNRQIGRWVEKGHATPKELDTFTKQISTDLGKSAKALSTLCKRRSKQIERILSNRNLTGFLREEYEGYVSSLKYASEAIEETGKWISNPDSYKFEFVY